MRGWFKNLEGMRGNQGEKTKERGNEEKMVDTTPKVCSPPASPSKLETTEKIQTPS